MAFDWQRSRQQEQQESIDLSRESIHETPETTETADADGDYQDDPADYPDQQAWARAETDTAESAEASADRGLDGEEDPVDCPDQRALSQAQMDGPRVQDNRDQRDQPRPPRSYEPAPRPASAVDGGPPGGGNGDDWKDLKGPKIDRDAEQKRLREEQRRNQQ